MSWTRWRRHFEQQATRCLPPIRRPAELDKSRHDALLASLRIFQLGETGEGRIVQQIRDSTLPSVDDDYREALRLFVAEEGRHAAILGSVIKVMGGAPLAHNWTHHLFHHARGLIGVRTKLAVLLAAEVIAVGFYGALASRLPDSDTRAALEQIVADEDHHLGFHCDFFRRQTASRWRKAVFAAAWWPLVTAACFTVALDHRRTLRAFGIGWAEQIRRCARAAARAGHLVLARRPNPAIRAQRRTHHHDQASRHGSGLLGPRRARVQRAHTR